MARVRGGLGQRCHMMQVGWKNASVTAGLQGFWEDKEMESEKSDKGLCICKFQFSSESFASKRYNFGFLLLRKLTLCIFKIIVFWLRTVS